MDEEVVRAISGVFQEASKDHSFTVVKRSLNTVVKDEKLLPVIGEAVRFYTRVSVWSLRLLSLRLEYTIRTPPFSRGMLYNRIFLRLIVLFKKMKLFDFMRMFYNPSTIVTTLRDHGLLRHDMPCPNCGDRMHERSYNNSDRLMFFCDKRTCRRKKTIRSSSFFENSRLALCDSMLFLHLWSRNYSEQLIIDDFSFCKKTVVDWSRFCRDLCVLDFESDTTLIGGP
jgi:hypothetical protein